MKGTKEEEEEEEEEGKEEESLKAEFFQQNIMQSTFFKFWIRV
jgi:hypothetical protein